MPGSRIMPPGGGDRSNPVSNQSGTVTDTGGPPSRGGERHIETKSFSDLHLTGHYQWPPLTPPSSVQLEPYIIELAAGSRLPKKTGRALVAIVREIDQVHGTDLTEQLQSVLEHYAAPAAKNRICPSRQMQAAYLLSYLLHRLNEAGAVPSIGEIGAGPSFDVGHAQCCPPWAARVIGTALRSGLFKAQSLLLADPALVPQYEREFFGLTALNVKLELLPMATVADIKSLVGNSERQELIDHLERRGNENFIKAILYRDYLDRVSNSHESEDEPPSLHFPFPLQIVTLRWFNPEKFDRVHRTHDAFQKAFDKFGFRQNALRAAELSETPDPAAAATVAAQVPFDIVYTLLHGSSASIPLGRRFYFLPGAFENPRRYAGLALAGAA